MRYTVVVEDGDEHWFNEETELLHRENGPAIVRSNGSKSWWLNGQRHRENGPAIEYSNGNKEWWINGTYLTEKEFNARTKPNCNGKIVEIDGKKYKLVEV